MQDDVFFSSHGPDGVTAHFERSRRQKSLIYALRAGSC
jgi:hypothetical protein